LNQKRTQVLFFDILKYQDQRPDPHSRGALPREYYLGLCQKGPVFPISAMVATISRAYSRLRETQPRSIRFRKYGPEKSFTRSGRGMIPSTVAGSNLAQFLTCSSDRKRFMVLQA
jgi:hypothetical protein